MSCGSARTWKSTPTAHPSQQLAQDSRPFPPRCEALRTPCVVRHMLVTVAGSTRRRDVVFRRPTQKSSQQRYRRGSAAAFSYLAKPHFVWRLKRIRRPGVTMLVAGEQGAPKPGKCYSYHPAPLPSLSPSRMSEGLFRPPAALSLARSTYEISHQAVRGGKLHK